MNTTDAERHAAGRRGHPERVADHQGDQLVGRTNFGLSGETNAGRDYDFAERG